MYACVCFWSSFQFKEKVSVKRNKVLVLKVRGELRCVLEVENLSRAAAAGTTHCCRRWAATPQGSVGRPPPWTEWRRPGSRAALNSGQTPPPTPWPPELQPRHSGEKGAAHKSGNTALLPVMCRRFNWVRGDSVRVSVQSKLSGIKSAMLSWKFDQTETYFKRVLWGTKLTETCLRNSQLYC